MKLVRFLMKVWLSFSCGFFHLEVLFALGGAQIADLVPPLNCAVEPRDSDS